MEASLHLLAQTFVGFLVDLEIGVFAAAAVVVVAAAAVGENHLEPLRG